MVIVGTHGIVRVTIGNINGEYTLVRYYSTVLNLFMTIMMWYYFLFVAIGSLRKKQEL